MARGMDLKLRRVEARVSIQDFAARLGRTRQTVRRYEELEVVPAEVVDQYLAALNTFTARPESAA